MAVLRGRAGRLSANTGVSGPGVRGTDSQALGWLADALGRSGQEAGGLTTREAQQLLRGLRGLELV